MTTELQERWYLAAKNDGLFIINRPPRPSNDDQVHDQADAPTVVIAVDGLREVRAKMVVDAHNASLDRAIARLKQNRATP